MLQFRNHGTERVLITINYGNSELNCDKKKKNLLTAFRKTLTVFSLLPSDSLTLPREQAAGAEDQPVPGAFGGQPRQDQLLHFLADQPGLPARRAVVRQARQWVGCR